MALRFLSSLLVALALLFAPAAMAADFGPAPSQEIQQHEGHCGKDDAPAEDRKAPVHTSCASSCAAVAPAASAPAPALPLAAPLPAPVPPARLAGIAPERETPPPRTAPENRI